MKTHGKALDAGDEVTAVRVAVTKNDSTDCRNDLTGQPNNLAGPEWCRRLQLKTDRRQVTQLAGLSRAVCIQVNRQCRIMGHTFKGTFCRIGEAQRTGNLEGAVASGA
mgnify:CR=1 FL=1